MSPCGGGRKADFMSAFESPLAAPANRPDGASARKKRREIFFLANPHATH
jgi:hypothetical protein